MPSSPRLTVAVLTAALLLVGCAAEEAADVASAPTATASPSPAASPSATASPSPAPSPDPSPEPCPEGEQRLTPGGDCFAPSPAAEPEPAPEPEPEPAPASNPCDDRSAREVTVTATNFAFSTSSIGDLCAGDTITLTVEEGSHSFTASSAGADTGVFSNGSRSVTVDAAPGTYNYVCQLHGQMNGTLTVVG